jgi:hypothetical protein
MPHQRRSCRRHSTWIIIFDFSDSASQKCHLVNGVYETDRALQSSFPNGFAKRMPIYMDSVLAALKSNSIRCSFCGDALWEFIAKIAWRVRWDILCQRHRCEESFFDECVEIVCCSYIARFVDYGKKKLYLSRDGYVYLLNECKMKARDKRKKRHCNENYLGRLCFADELHRSFDEFVQIVISAFGYVPLEYRATTD